MRLLRLAHSILDRSVLVLCWFCGSLARVSGLLARGSLGSVAGLALVLWWFLLLLVILYLKL